MLQSSDISRIQERGDLDRLGYNVLSSVIESGTIELTIEREELYELELKTFIQRLLPASTLYNFSIYNYTLSENWTEKEEVITLTNMNDETSMDFYEVSSTSTILTSRKGNIYAMILALARAGGGRISEQ